MQTFSKGTKIFILIIIVLLLGYGGFKFLYNKYQMYFLPKIKSMEKCEERGGEWGGLGGNCYYITSDGGKKCIKSSQCKSICFLDYDYTVDENELEKDEDGYFVGKCHPYKPYMPGRCGGELNKPTKTLGPFFSLCDD